MTTEQSPRLVVGVSGASGIPLALRTVEALSAHFEVHAVISDAAKTVMAHETADPDAALERIRGASTAVYDESDSVRRSSPARSGRRAWSSSRRR